MLAVAATFAASGVLHELAHVLLNGRTSPRLTWLCFFVAQVVVVGGS